MIRLFGLFIFFLFFSSASFGGDLFGPATPQTGVNQMNFENDLSPLSNFFDNGLSEVEVIGMGENIHGTHEPHTIRFNVIKLLVQKYHFRIVAFEAPWTSSLITTKYVENCQGDLKSAQMGLVFGAWYDQSVGDLLQWLCQFNQQHPKDKVTLFGFDIQNPSKGDKVYLSKFFQKVDPNYFAQITDLAKCTQWGDPSQSSTDLSICDNQLKLISKRIFDFEQTYITASSPYEVFLAKISIRSIQAWQYENFFLAAQDLSKGYESRDSGMADLFNNFRSLYGQKKAIIYAHNYHVAFNMDHRDPQQDIVAKSMGTFLKNQFREKYFSIGFIAYETQINHKIFPDPPWTNPPLPIDAESIEKKLHAIGFTSGFIQPNKGFLLSNVTYKFNDQGYQWQQAGNPFDYYDLLFFSDKSGPLIYPY